MRGAVMHAPGDVRVQDREAPAIVDPTDAIIGVSAACICGSDLWPYRGIEEFDAPMPMGHEYVGVVEEVGRDVKTIDPGQFVVGSFFASDNTCEICRGRLPQRVRQARGYGRHWNAGAAGAGPARRWHPRRHP
jgi:threonine dehydrogenase-like Zn-dependent dehydrogenase